MLVSALILFLTSALFFWLGYLLHKKQRIGLIHDYHYRKVQKEDIPAYTEQMGIGLYFIGAGLADTAIFSLFFSSGWVWLCFALGFGIGFAIMHRAQMQYNGGWFS